MRASIYNKVLQLNSRDYSKKYAELSFSAGIALGLIQQYGDWLLHIHFIFINIFIHLQPGAHEEGDINEDKQYGFSYHGKGLWFHWGQKSTPSNGDASHKQARYWVLWMPWGYKSAFKQDYFNHAGEFMFTLQPCHLPHKLYTAEKEIKKSISRSFPYQYKLQSGQIQQRIATIYATQMYWRMRGLPFIVKKNKSIEIEFNDEVGERSGTYKGGVIGCSYKMKKYESPEETLRRMEIERIFK